MITSVAVQAYLARIAELFKEQGFDPSMNVIYDAEEAQTEEWISDELAGKHDADGNRMQRKGMTTKDDVRKKPFMALFWTRSSLEPIIRRPYRLIDSPDDGVTGPAGKSTVNGKFRIACAFVSNKAEAVEDLEEAFAARFQSTYNVPISLEFIYNSAEKRPEEAKTNFTVIQNMGEADLVNYKEGNLFAYAWGAEIHMNCVSEFAWSHVFPVEKVVVDLYDPKGIPLASLDASPLQERIRAIMARLLLRCRMLFRIPSGMIIPPLESGRRCRIRTSQSPSRRMMLPGIYITRMPAKPI